MVERFFSNQNKDKDKDKEALFGGPAIWQDEKMRSLAGKFLFSDLNDLKVVTTISARYQTSFRFTEEEVFSAMAEFSMAGREGVKQWYDGFIFGNPIIQSHP